MNCNNCFFSNSPNPRTISQKSLHATTKNRSSWKHFPTPDMTLQVANGCALGAYTMILSVFLKPSYLVLSSRASISHSWQMIYVGIHHVAEPEMYECFKMLFGMLRNYVYDNSSVQCVCVCFCVRYTFTPATHTPSLDSHCSHRPSSPTPRAGRGRPGSCCP